VSATGTAHPPVSVVVVNFDGRRHLEACFGALTALRYPASAVELVMVDNGSSDGSVDLVRERFPSVRVLVNDVNNYCRANNLGIAATDAPYVALLNNDTRVDPDWLGPLVAALEAEPGVAAAGSAIYTAGVLASAGHRRTVDFYWEDRPEAVATRAGAGAPIDVDSLSGCAVLYRRRALDQVGPLDERFNLYLEDVDLAIRLRARGWSLVFVPTSVVHHVHHGTATAELARSYSERNRLLVLAKHFPRELAAAMTGRGFFSVGHDGERGGRAGLSAATPDLVTTLLDHHGPALVREVLPAVVAELQRIASGDDAIAVDRARRAALDLANLHEEIRRRDENLAVKDQFNASLCDELAARERLLADKDAYITSLEDELGLRDRLIRDKDAYITSLEDELGLRDRLIRDKDAYVTSLEDELRSREQVVRDAQEMLRR
jgi:GT2 family glycosyltransferase